MVKKLADVLSSFETVELAYIFGSYLTDERYNDIDVALLIKEDGPSTYEGLKMGSIIGRELEQALGFQKEIDVKILNFSPLPFQYGVICRGQPVFVRDPIRKVRYECRVISEYLDYKDVLEFHNQKFLEML